MHLEKSYDENLLTLVPPEGPPWLGLNCRKLLNFARCRMLENAMSTLKNEKCFSNKIHLIQENENYLIHGTII